MKERPKIEDYNTGLVSAMQCTSNYVEAMERYCDKAEAEIKELKALIKSLESQLKNERKDSHNF